MFKKLLLLMMLIFSTINANNFRDGMIAFKKNDFVKARQSFEKAIMTDKILSASYMLGRMYLHGKGVSVNFNKAIELLEYAYSHGNIPAGCYLSEAHIKNDMYAPRMDNNQKIYLANEGTKKGMAIHLPYCEKVFTMWKRYKTDLANFSNTMQEIGVEKKFR